MTRKRRAADCWKPRASTNRSTIRPTIHRRPPAPHANLPPATEISQKRWQQLLDRPRRPHTPGVWIVYFSLASLPIFGIGQLFIPAQNTASRRYVFLLLCVYVGCGLSLLLTTSFLSLRRYLRKRRLEMPAVMASNWLVIGGVMVVGLLLFSALLPRPAPEYAISALPGKIGSAQHGASSLSAGSEGVRDPAAGSDSGVDHTAQQSSDQPPGQSDQSAGADTHQTSTGPGGQVAGKSGSPSSDKGSQGSTGKSAQQSGEKPSSPSSDNQSSAKPPGTPPAAGQQPASQSPASSDSKTDQQPAAPPQNATPSNAQPQNTPPAADPNAQAAPQAADKPPSERGQPAAAPQPSAGNSPPPPTPPASPPLPNPGSIFGALAGLLKWVLYAAVIGGMAYGAWRSRAELIEIVTGWLAALRDFWQSLFGGQKEIGRSAEEVAFHQQQLLWSFGDFIDPFASGMAAKSSPAEVVKYTFAALEVWGREHGFPRDSDATPHEFVALLGSKIPRLRPDALALANLYSRAVYSQDSLPPAVVGNLAELWRLMHSARVEQPAVPQ